MTLDNIWARVDIEELWIIAKLLIERCALVIFRLPCAALLCHVSGMCILYPFMVETCSTGWWPMWDASTGLTGFGSGWFLYAFTAALPLVSEIVAAVYSLVTPHHVDPIF